jgi:hypothetical protein
MSITEFTQTRGTEPDTPLAVDVALEAGVTNDRATAMIAASWSLAETFTGRLYWPVSAAVAVATLDADGDTAWPRYPFPDAVTVELWDGSDWTADAAAYIPELGAVTGLVIGKYKITQTGTTTPDTPGSHVVEAVRALALYQLIHSPARREFRQINAGDSSLTRESLAGLFRASGAGMLLAGEVRF